MFSGMARPTKMTDETLNKLREAFMIGCSDEEACYSAGITTTTLYNYQKQNPEFIDQKEVIKTNPKLKARRAIYNSLDDPKIAMWYLERKVKEEFSPRLDINPEQPKEDQEVDLSGLSKEEQYQLYDLIKRGRATSQSPRES